MNTPLESIRIFRGTLAEVEAAETIDKSIYFATDTNEMFVGNAAGKKVQYSGGTFKTNAEVMEMIKEYNSETVSELKTQINSVNDVAVAALPKATAISDYATKSDLSKVEAEITDSEDDIYSGDPVTNGYIGASTISKAKVAACKTLRIIFAISQSVDASGKYNYFSISVPVDVILDSAKANVVHCPCSCIGQNNGNEDPVSLFLMDAQVYWNDGIWLKVWKSAMSASVMTAPAIQSAAIYRIVGVK